MPEEQKSSSVLGIAVAVVITAILVGGGVYLWQQSTINDNSNQNKNVNQDTNVTKNTNQTNTNSTIKDGAQTKAKLGNGFCGWQTNGDCQSDRDCETAGCTGQLCKSKSEKSAFSTCEALECYDDKKYEAECGCVNEKCQWRNEDRLLIDEASGQLTTIHDNFQAAVNDKDYATMQSLMASSVYFIKEATECCGNISAARSAQEMIYFDDVLPFNFDQNQQIVRNIKTNLIDFSDETVGIAPTEEVISYHVNSSNQVDEIYLNISHRNLDIE